MIGARLFHVIDHWPHEYAAAPLRVLYIWEGGLAIWGAVVGGLIALALFTWRRGVRLSPLLDAVTPGLVLGQAIGRAACIITGDAVGKATAGPFGLAYTKVPSHQGPDIQTIMPDLDITTMAGAGPYNLSHIHFAMVETTRSVSLDELRDALWDAPRIAFVRAADGLVALNAVIELMRDLDRPRGDMWEVAVWEDALASDGREVYLTFQVHNEAIVVPENVDCIRALTNLEPDGARSIAKTNAALGITKSFLPATTQPIPHVAGPDVMHPAIAAVQATHARFRAVGFKGSEDPTEPTPTRAQPE